MNERTIRLLGEYGKSLDGQARGMAYLVGINALTTFTTILTLYLSPASSRRESEERMKQDTGAIYEFPVNLNFNWCFSFWI